MTIKQTIEKHQKILVTSHLGPDCDAIASSLFVYNTIKENYPKKEINISINTEGFPQRYSIFKNIDKIQLKPLLDIIKKHQPTLIILTDGGMLKMFITEQEVEKYNTLLLNNKIETVSIDHHDSHDFDLFTYNFRESRPSAVEVAYKIMHKDDGMVLFDGWEQIVLFGMIADSDRFYFESDFLQDSLELALEITKKGFSIRKIDDLINCYEPVELEYMAELFTNIKFDKDYLYSFISENRIKIFKRKGLSSFARKIATRKVIDSFMNHTSSYNFCFVITPPSEEQSHYNISVRSKENTIDCTQLLKKFNGGGYVTGGGGKIDSNSLKKAIAITKERIAEFLVEQKKS